jgi:predicted anti-sigma-YlaC factor YlaD
MSPSGNQAAAANDQYVMQCSSFRGAVSARLDGEPLGMSERALDSHLATCAACAAWADDAALVTRRARLAPAPPVPDLTLAVLEALPRELPGVAAAARARVVTTALRLALLAVGIAQAGLAWPALASGAGSMSAPVHMAHETGAWNLAVAVALVAVAAAPRLAAGTLVFLGSFVAFLAPVTLADLAAGRVQVDRAVAHLLLLAGTALVVAVAWRGRQRRERRLGRRVAA